MRAPIRHIIIQAGGKGTRMGHLCANKPKGLIPVNGQPLILRVMSQHPAAHFYIIADYHKDILRKYLAVFAEVTYTLIETNDQGTCAGIKDALAAIPPAEPFALLWCDLFFEKVLWPQDLCPDRDNYIGLSRNFVCRWKFEQNSLFEEASDRFGIAGVYLFKNKQELAEIPASGEFCRFLQHSELSFSPYFLDGASEVGTLDSYRTLCARYPVTRPFNHIVFKENHVIKSPRSSLGTDLAVYEQNWYEKLRHQKWSFLPEIYSIDPLHMQRIYGEPLYKAPIATAEKVSVLSTLVQHLKEIHQGLPVITGDFAENNTEALIAKTKRRLDSIASLIPLMDNDYIVINGLRCINFYQHWDLVIQMISPFFSNQYRLIHGDCTFSNTLYDEETKALYLIDPRGYFGTLPFYGDEDYDWAKLYYSLSGNYDQFNAKEFRLTFADNTEVLLGIASNGWEHLSDSFFALTGRSRLKIQAYHAMIWLSLSSYAFDDYDSICGAFYMGIYQLQQTSQSLGHSGELT